MTCHFVLTEYGGCAHTVACHPCHFISTVCQAPKRRFKPYTAPVARNANDLAVRKARKDQLKAADTAIG